MLTKKLLSLGLDEENEKGDSERHKYTYKMRKRVR